MIRLTSKNPGPTVLILGGVHGNEGCGVKAIEEIKTWKIQKGTVMLEIGNPEAVKRNVRYTEENLNRMFLPEDMMTEETKQSYEYTRAQYLKTLMSQADILIDIHASNTPESIPFVIAEESAKSIISQLPVLISCSGFDTFQPGGTDYYMNSLGKIGICIECGYTKDDRSTETAINSVKALLVAQGMIPGNINRSPQKQLRVFQQYYTCTDSFILTKNCEDFEFFPVDTLIGYDGETAVYASQDSYILFARNRKKAGEEAFLLLA